MDIVISSDDSSHSDEGRNNSLNKLADADECLDLTQDDDDVNNIETGGPTYNSDALFDDLLPPVKFGGVSGLSKTSTISSSTSTSSSGTTSSGYGSSSGSITTKRRSKKITDNTEERSTKKTTSERMAKKQKIAEDRAARQVANEFNKVYKPGECMKYMHIEMHPSLLAKWYCADVKREAAAVGARVDPTPDICDGALVLWSRRTPQALQAKNGQVELSPARVSCPRGLYVACLSDLAEHILEHRLATHVREVKELAGRTLTLAIFGVKEYFKKSNRKTQNSNRNLITEIELEMALTDLLVSANCDTSIVNTPNELALLIVQFTKAIAEEPHKKIKRNFDEQAEFYMRGDNKKCVAVDKDGNGASRLWQQMIAVLPGSSLETSRAVCAQYKSPLALYQALQLPNGVNELADVGVARAGVPGSKTRRLGPEFARRLHTLLTSEDGDVLLD